MVRAITDVSTGVSLLVCTDDVDVDAYSATSCDDELKLLLKLLWDDMRELRELDV